MIQVHQLRESFGEFQAVAGVDFNAGRGTLFGFLGPNGAGMATTVHMLTGLVRPHAERLQEHET